MRVAVQKLSGVESVNVSLERAVTDIQLRPGNSITLEQLRTIIKNNGFTAKEATVTVVGKLIERGGHPALDVSGTNTVILLVVDPTQSVVFKQVQDRLRANSGATVRLTGVVESQADSPDRLAVRAISDESHNRVMEGHARGGSPIDENRGGRVPLPGRRAQ